MVLTCVETETETETLLNSLNAFGACRFCDVSCDMIVDDSKRCIDILWVYCAETTFLIWKQPIVELGFRKKICRWNSWNTLVKITPHKAATGDESTQISMYFMFLPVPWFFFSFFYAWKPFQGPWMRTNSDPANYCSEKWQGPSHHLRWLSEELLLAAWQTFWSSEVDIWNYDTTMHQGKRCRESDRSLASIKYAQSPTLGNYHGTVPWWVRQWYSIIVQD